MNAKIETPQEAIDNATAQVAAFRSQNGVTNVELAVKLAEAQSRFYAAQQSEVKNLQAFIESPHFNGNEKAPAKERLKELLKLT